MFDRIMGSFDGHREADELADVGVDTCAASDAADSDGNAELNELAGQLNVVNARLVAQVERLLATGDWEQGGKRTPAAFVAWQLGLSPERAGVVVRVAERRSEFPVVMGAFDRGELSLEQVAEAVKAPAWADAEIAHFCHIATPAKIRRAMRSNMFESDPTNPNPNPSLRRTGCRSASVAMGLHRRAMVQAT